MSPQTQPAIETLIARLQDYYDFQCDGGPLRNCVEWQQLVEALTAETQARQAAESDARDNLANWTAEREARQQAERELASVRESQSRRIIELGPWWSATAEEINGHVSRADQAERERDDAILHRDTVRSVRDLVERKLTAAERARAQAETQRDATLADTAEYYQRMERAETAREALRTVLADIVNPAGRFWNLTTENGQRALAALSAQARETTPPGPPS